MYVDPDDFRTATAKWFAKQLTLTDTEIADPDLAEVIAYASGVIDDECSDHFEPEPGGGPPEPDTTLDVDARTSGSLRIPKRVRSLTQVQTRDKDGNLTLEAASTYRLTKSLDSAGITAVRQWDFLDVVGGQWLSTGEATWPEGIQTVRLTGTFSWAVVPRDIQRAVALLVFDVIKGKNVELHRATRVHTDQASYDQALTEPTGLPEVDRIIARFGRSYAGVG